MAPSFEFVLAVVLSVAATLVFNHALWLLTAGVSRPDPGRFRPHRSLARLAERHGPLTCIWFGRYPIVVASTPDAARKVLACSELAGRTVLDTIRAEGHADNCVLLLPPGPKWRTIRRLVMAEVQTKGQLAAREQLRQEKARELVRYVSERAARGEPVDVGHAAFVTAVDLVSRTLISVDIGSRELRDKVRECAQLLTTPTIADVFPSLAAADLQGARRRFSALVRYSNGIVDEEFVRRRRGRDAGEPRKNDMVDLVIDKEKEWEEEGSELNYDVVRCLITDLFLAGSETVSSTVEWAMAELLQSPKSMEMVKEELKAVIGTKGQVAESDITQLPYLQAVVKEAFRLHPAKFMPERFIGKDISYWGKDFELIPFSAGRRQCLGLPLAHRMVHLILGSLLYHFDWTLPADVKDSGIGMSENSGVMVSMATPRKAIAKKCDE
ncbi:hypothetical protein PAHAL_1G327600 [Panicum hallii]|uniref:Cytochrome P450 n=1 Tax=Panicum hallii TaxID=206008 RepID=A0A2T8KX05_9POAL|nr:hypothetical protein PAHAL_1G327600 [Panicum hallii]